MSLNLVIKMYIVIEILMVKVSKVQSVCGSAGKRADRTFDKRHESYVNRLTNISQEKI